MKYLRLYLFVVLFLVYFYVYQGALSHVVWYHEQHHLFLFSSAYLRESVLSEGWVSYLTDFIIQFFYYPVLGSAIMAFMLASVYLLVSLVCRQMGIQNGLFQLSVLPSLGLFFYSMSVDHSLTLIVAVLLFLLAAYLCVWFVTRFWKIPSLFFRHRILNKRLRMGITCLFLAGYAVGGYFYFIRSYNVSERIMLKTEFYARKKDWGKVLDYTERYLQAGRSNRLISYFHNLALYHAGKLPYRLFDYPQGLGVKGLYFAWESDSRISEYGHFLYEELGYINEAHRWEFESMVVWGETASHLLNLARYNIINNRPKVAQRFINVLKQSLFYRSDALQLEQSLSSGSLPGLKNALRDVEDNPIRFANVLSLGPELKYLCERDSTNRMAFEYLMSDLLLSNQVERFAENLKLIRHFSYSQLPPAYEEALYIYKLGIAPEDFEKLGFTVSYETEKRFKRYYELLQSNQLKKLQEEFGNTYWFYLNYISPYGNKVISI